MKKILASVILYFTITSSYAQSHFFYYYFDDKISLTLNKSLIYIGTGKVLDAEKIRTILGSDYEVVLTTVNYRYKNPYLMAEVKLKKTYSESEYLALISKLNETTEFDNVSPSFLSESGEKADLSHLFNVQIKTPDDYDKLLAFAKKTNTEILQNNKDMPSWYSLSCSKNSTGNALTIANMFYESDQFVTAAPDFFACAKTLMCSSDPNFTKQWGLNNTGQTAPSGAAAGIAGVDIGACQAWEVTTGKPYIITAVVDDGYLQTHPDLISNDAGISFDANHSGPSRTYTSHGTEVAGIISASQNNGIGISGVSPNSRMESVSINIGASPVSFFTNAINWAANTGNASIINISWRIALPDATLTSAIIQAMTTGRNGLGCIVLGAAGNTFPSALSYPANVNDPSNPSQIRVLSVGGVDICGKQSGINPNTPPSGTIVVGALPIATNSCDPWPWDLTENASTAFCDVVGPGSDISTTFYDPTTHTIGYIDGLNGTSGAVAYASGIAALILSLDPCLTENEVLTIIEKSCTKVDASTLAYGATTGRPNGSFNALHGYGLINANLAVQMVAKNMYLQHITESGTILHANFQNIYAGFNVDPTNPPHGNYEVLGNSQVEIKSGSSISFKPGTIAQPSNNGFMYAHIESFNNNCASWPNAMKTNSPSSEVSNFSRPHLEGGITIYPNPVLDNFTIKFSIDEDVTNASVEISDVTGRVVYSKKESFSKGDYALNIPVTSASSVYIVRFCAGSDCIVRKLVKYVQE